MRVVLDGSAIRTERDFHRQLARLLDFGPYYGNNLDALWDRVSKDVERPVELVWEDSAASREHLGDDLFGTIVKLLSDAQQHDIDAGYPDRFTIELR
jgi:ribonuclease inhibitor